MNMKKYKNILFDLDGTLTDPAHGLTLGFEYALYKMGMPPESREALRRFIGPPLLDVWQTEYGLTKAESERMIALFREYYDIYGWWDNTPYPDIEKQLGLLKDRGYRLFVATSKPERTAKRVLSLFGLDKYFEFIGGAESGSERYTKTAVLKYVLESTGAEPSDAILVGDRMYDAEGAAQVGIDSLGVLWGHGSRTEIESSGFTGIIEHIADLSAVF